MIKEFINWAFYYFLLIWSKIKYKMVNTDRQLHGDISNISVSRKVIDVAINKCRPKLVKKLDPIAVTLHFRTICMLDEDESEDITRLATRSWRNNRLLDVLMPKDNFWTEFHKY